MQSLEERLGAIPAYVHHRNLRLRSLGVPRIADVRIENFRTKWSPQEEARLRSALCYIPAVERHIWLLVGMAIHEAGWGARGYAIWREWSQTAPEKYNDDDQARTWESFDRTSHNGRRVTLASIFHMAIERGWTGNNTPNQKIQDQSSVSANATAANGGEWKNRASSDDDNEISRLAKLSLIEYERERKDAAERLNLRASILDRLVAAERDKFDDDGKQGHALRLPETEPWPDPINGANLLDEVSDAIYEHVVMANWQADTAALFAVHTYLLDCFGISPRLAITSPEKGCGKTTLIDVLSRLVKRPLPTTNATVSAIFRIVEILQPTLLIDEADTFLSENDELRGVLNSGHRQGGFVLRTVGDDFEPRRFSTYSACAVALIGKLSATLADRAVPIDLRRRRPDEAIEPFRFDRTEHLDRLARKAARWALDNADRIRGADPVMPTGVFNRAADNWRPLLAIADAAGGEWSARARQAVQDAGAAADGEQSVRVLLLSDIRAIFAERGTDRLASGELVSALVAIEGRPWAEWGKARKPLTTNSLAGLLAPFKIRSGTIRIGERTPKGYHLGHFEDAFTRYLPQGGA